MYSFKKHYYALFLPLTLIPRFASAAINDAFDLEFLIYQILVRLGQLFFTIATAFFIWGVVKFIRDANDSAEREQGKQFIIWGIIALVVLVSLWGLVRLLLVDTLNITPGALQYVSNPFH